jgi:NitT/TauT family transport system ATP-binding protein
MQGELVRLWQRARFTAVMVTHDVEEALLMANRVVVFSERPARIKAILNVDRPYPRHRDDPALQSLRSQILDLMGFGEA